MKVLLEEKRKIILALLMGAALLFFAGIMYNTYDAYTKMVVEQQQQHLLLISRAVAQNMELYISDQLRDIRSVTQTPGFLESMEYYYTVGETARMKEYIFSYMQSHQQDPVRIYVLDRYGQEIFHYNQYPFSGELDEEALGLAESARKRESGIGNVFPIDEQRCGMTLVTNVYGGNGYLGTVISVMDLDVLYKRYVANLNFRDQGDIVVKDGDGNIIMHPDSRMLQFNYERDIPELDSMPQYESLRRMLEKQYTYEEGTAVYDSYSGGILPREQVIAAFSRMNLSGNSWYVSTAMPYSKAVELQNNMLKRFGLLAATVLFLVIAAGTIIYHLLRNRQKLRLETKYLKEINSTLEELHQSREEARHYQKLTTIGTLAGGIAHEFNNLLTPILGYSEFLEEQLGRKSEYFEDIAEIHKAGTRAKEIVEQILPFSRKETDTTSFKSVNLEVIIRDALKMIRLIIPSNIRLEEKLDDGNVNVYGNATQLHQVLLNLYSNACQAMEKDGGLLSVKTRRISREELPEHCREMADGDYVEIAVCDTGCGMSEEVLHQIFNPFFTTKEAGEGTGLGLSVVKDILINHSGAVSAQSRPGEGSCFYIYLPVTIGVCAVQIQRQPEKREEVKQISIALIDDEESVVKYLRKRLERWGYHVDGYTDPEEALEDMVNGRIHWNAVIVDYMMPGIKGTALAQRMKKLQPYLCVIMITGLVDREALELRQDGQIDNILIKPVNFEELVAAIDKGYRRQLDMIEY